MSSGKDEAADLADALAGASERIERVALEPSRAPTQLVRIVAPLLRKFGRRASFGVQRIRALLAELKKPARLRTDGLLTTLAKSAVEELDENVTAVERIAESGRAPIAHAAWLRRLHGVVASAVAAATTPEDDDADRIARSIDPVFVLKPLVSPIRSEAGSPGRPIEIELAAIDILVDAARRETTFLSRKRRLLEAARQLLLAANAAARLDGAGVEARRKHIAEGIVWIDRVQAAGVDLEVGLVHQARSALGRGEVDRLHAVLVAIDDLALCARDERVGARTRSALDRLRIYAGALHPTSSRAREISLERSAREIFGDRVVGSVEEAYAHARETLRIEDAHIQKLATAYFKKESVEACFAAMTASDGWMEVGGGLSPMKISELVPHVRTVRYPTPELALSPVEDVSDLPSALIDDPRTLLLSLAEGTLLSRKFLLREGVPRQRTVRTGEVRIYVLDGSGSMVFFGSGGARARMRDAILLAELATLAKRLRDRRVHRAVLFYRYFDTVIGPITRVDSVDGAHAAMRDVICSVRTGGTDIEAALVASFAQVQEAHDIDPELARGQVVLITDGDAKVREERVEAARQAAGIPVGLSVIALGMENPALRDLVAHQREAGERAFYHFMSDEQLLEITKGHVDQGLSLHLVRLKPPLEPVPVSPAARAEQLEALTGELLEELAAIEHARHTALVDIEMEHELDKQAKRASLAELGLDVGPLDEAELARREALDRDHRGLGLRFSRWFPAPDETRTEPPRDGTPEHADLSAALVVLETVAEIVNLVGGSPYARRADAIEMVERLLPDATLSPGRYATVLRDHPGLVARALRAVHAAVEPGASD